MNGVLGIYHYRKPYVIGEQIPAKISLQTPKISFHLQNSSVESQFLVDRIHNKVNETRVNCSS